MHKPQLFDKEAVIERLKPFFKLGCSIHLAGQYAGIDPQVVYRWMKDDEDVKILIEQWQGEISAKARANWREKIASGDYQASKEWLERNFRERGEFSQKFSLDITTRDASLEEIPDEQLIRVLQRKPEVIDIEEQLKNTNEIVTSPPYGDRNNESSSDTRTSEETPA